MNLDREFMTPKEAAQKLGVSSKTVYRAIMDGALPAIRFRKQWRIPMAALNASVRLHNHVQGRLG